MEKWSKPKNSIHQKENQQKLVNKRTDLLSSLHNIKLPLQTSQSYKEKQFQSVPTINSLTIEQDLSTDIASQRQFKQSKLSMELTLTEEYCNNYGDDVQLTLRRQQNKGRFLTNHKIDGLLRARMLDWMVEVMCSYNFQNKTYFAGVEIMDRYFANCNEVLLPTQLHIIGVVSMLIASKMQEVYPLKMNTVHDKITHKKISILQLTEMEHKITEALKFELVSASFYDLAVAKIAHHLSDNDLYSEDLMKQIEEVCSCLAKFIYYNYELVSHHSKDTIVLTLGNYVLNIYKFIPLGKQTSASAQCRQSMIDLMINFKRKHKGLNNLAKFTDKKIFEIIEIAIV